MVRMEETFTMSISITHGKGFCWENVSINFLGWDMDNFSFRQPSWTPSWKWPFSDGQNGGDFYYVNKHYKWYQIPLRKRFYQFSSLRYSQFYFQAAILDAILKMTLFRWSD
jgi:hypothetical protein